MFPNASLSGPTPPARQFRRQTRLGRMGGFSLPAAIFILVILALLAAVVYRTVAVSNSSVALEMLSARAFLAAESGAHAAMMQVFPTDGSAANCGLPTWNLTSTGFYDCTVSVRCTPVVADGETVYSIGSTGRCQAGNLQASRSLTVMAHE